MRTEKHNSFGRIKATLMLASAFSVAGASNAYSTIPEMSMGESTNIHAVDQKNIKIKGIIVDGSGTPIIGANVIIEGTSVGSITGMDGDFEIADAPRSGTLIVSYIGYITQRVKINQKMPLRITLEEDQQTLNEVVVVGYGTMKKSDITGAISSAILR